MFNLLPGAPSSEAVAAAFAEAFANSLPEYALAIVNGDNASSPATIPAV